MYRLKYHFIPEQRKRVSFPKSQQHIYKWLHSAVLAKTSKLYPLYNKHSVCLFNDPTVQSFATSQSYSTCMICVRVLSHDRQFSLNSSVSHCSTKQPSKQIPLHLRNKTCFNHNCKKTITFLGHLISNFALALFMREDV